MFERKETGSQLTRRRLLAGLLAPAALPRPRRLPAFAPEAARYNDPSTEFPVVRLTSAEHASSLPRPPLRGVSRRKDVLLYSSDRTGSPQLFRMEASGESRQLTEAQNLDGSRFSLLPDERSAVYFDGASMRHLVFATGREREAYRLGQGWRWTEGFSVTADGRAALVAETDGKKWRLRRVSLDRPAEPATVLESSEPLSDPKAGPASAGVLYRKGEALWVGDRRMAVAAGAVLDAYWSSGGERVLYLNRPDDPAQLNSIREVTVAENMDRLVAPTSQFASFAPNGDGSVFLGASANRASPFMLLLLRKARRELTLCEHQTSDARLAWPVFAPDSQRVYFHSDRHGKRAIYTLGVARLVERTE